MEVMIKISAAVLTVIMLMFVILATAQVFDTISVVRDAAQAAVLSQVTVNAPSAFAGFRESSGAARYFDEADWQYSVDDTEVLSHLTERFGLDGNGVRYSEGIRQFTLRGINTHSVNAEGKTVTFWSTLSIDIPIHFGGVSLGDISKELKVKAIYDKRY